MMSNSLTLSDACSPEEWLTGGGIIPCLRIQGSTERTNFPAAELSFNRGNRETVQKNGSDTRICLTQDHLTSTHTSLYALSIMAYLTHFRWLTICLCVLLVEAVTTSASHHNHHTSAININATTEATNEPRSGRKGFDLTITWEDHAPDGFNRKMLLVNGTSPGPLLEMNEGDWVEIAVHNQSPFNTTIHYHGSSAASLTNIQTLTLT